MPKNPIVREITMGEYVYLRSHHTGEARYPQLEVVFTDTIGKRRKVKVWAAQYRVDALLIEKFGTGSVPRIRLVKGSKIPGPEVRAPKIFVLTAGDEETIPVRIIEEARTLA